MLESELSDKNFDFGGAKVEKWGRESFKIRLLQYPKRMSVTTVHVPYKNLA